jgi:hypothetical protein
MAYLDENIVQLFERGGRVKGGLERRERGLAGHKRATCVMADAPL